MISAPLLPESITLATAQQTLESIQLVVVLCNGTILVLIRETHAAPTTIVLGKSLLSCSHLLVITLIL